MAKYKLSWKDLSWNDFKIYLFALSYQSNSIISKNTDGESVLEEISNLENQNSIESRIQEDTVSLKTHAIYESPEFNLQSISDYPSTANQHYSLVYSLGDSSLSSANRPAWDIKFLQGEISGSAEYSTGSHQPILIPNLESI